MTYITEMLYNSVIMIKQLISDEKFTNIQKAQAGLTRLFTEAEATTSFFRVMKNDQPLGVLIPNSLWQRFVEDLEALSSTAYRSRIARAREERETIPAAEVKKRLGM